MRRLARSSLATGGDAVHRRFRRRTLARRKLVVLCDVSGSMEAYSRAMLLYLHALMRSGRGVEVFAFGTRLTRVTTELATRDPDAALRAAADRVVDWAAGTRIGESLRVFNDVWGRRALSRGAVILIVSDGWERGDNARLGREMARLHRAAFALVWVSPLKGKADISRWPAGCERRCRSSIGLWPDITWPASRHSANCSSASSADTGRDLRVRFGPPGQDTEREDEDDAADQRPVASGAGR